MITPPRRESYPYGLTVLNNIEDIVILYQRVSEQIRYEKLTSDKRFEKIRFLNKSLTFISPHHNNKYHFPVKLSLIITPYTPTNESSYKENLKKAEAIPIEKNLLRTLVKFYSEDEIIRVFEKIKDEFYKQNTTENLDKNKRKSVNDINLKKPYVFHQLMGAKIITKYPQFYASLNYYEDRIFPLNGDPELTFNLFAIVIFRELIVINPIGFIDEFISIIKEHREVTSNEDDNGEFIYWIDINEKIINYIKCYIDKNFTIEQSQSFLEKYTTFKTEDKLNSQTNHDNDCKQRI